MNESIQSRDKYLWSACPVPRTAHYKREWNGAQGRQTSRTIAKVYISREEWVTSQTVIPVFKKINRARDEKVIQRLYSRGKGIGMGAFSCWSLSCVQLFATPWTAARQASLSITTSRGLLKLMSIELVMPSNHLILYGPLLLPSILLQFTPLLNEGGGVQAVGRWCKHIYFLNIYLFDSATS